MVKILVSDKLPKEGLAILEAEKDFQVDVKTGLPPEDLKKIIGEYDGIGEAVGGVVISRFGESALRSRWRRSSMATKTVTVSSPLVYSRCSERT